MEKNSNELHGVSFSGSVTFNGPMFDIHDNQQVHVNVQGLQQEVAQLNHSEQEVKNVITKVMEEKGADGEYIWTDQEQWYAAHKVLSTFCGYPVKPKDFERVMKNIGSDKMRIPCKYDNFRKVALHQLPVNLLLWRQYEKTADQYSLKFIKVALKLMDIIGVKA